MATQSRAPSKTIQNRIAKRGAITDADIQEYIDEVGIANLGNMSMNDVEKFLKTFVELGQREKKKKLPTKKKIEPTDSIIVADENGELAKVSTGDAAKTSGGSDEKPSRPISDMLLGAGVFTVKKMFPTLGKLIDAFEKQNKKNERDLQEVNESNKESAQQVSRSSLLMSRIAESQLKTNELLEKIIEAAANPPTASPPPAPGDGGPNVEIDMDGPRRRSSQAPRQQSRMGAAGRYAVGGAAILGVGALGYGAYRAFGGGGAATQATPVRAESGRFNMRGEEGELTATYSRTAEGRHTIDEREVDAETYNRFRQLATVGPARTDRELQQDPRFQQYREQAAASGGDLNPEWTARDRIRDEDRASRNTELFALMQRVRSQPVGQRQAAAQRQESQASAAGLDARILNIKAKEIVFKADNFEFDRPNAVPGGAAGAPPPVTATNPSSGGGASATAAAGTSDGIQTIVQRVTQEFPGVNVTSGTRPGSGTSQHATGNAVDLSLRGLSQDQRATLVQNLTSGRYGNVGGLGTYNATGDLLHVDTRSGPKMAWGPNRSRTSLNETPQWFQQAVASWMGGAGGGGAAAGGGEQEPRPGGEPAAVPAPSTPSSGVAVAQASVRSETSMMQSQAPTTVPGAADQASPPTGSVEQTATVIDPNEPGSVEPADAAQRYAKLFNLAA